MLRKPLFIVHAGVQKTKRLSSKSGRGNGLSEYINAKFQVSASVDKINELLLYNKK